MPLSAAEYRKLYDTLAELGGRADREEDVKHSGTKIILPDKMSVAQGIQYLTKYMKDQEEVSSFQHEFLCRPWDGAYNAWRAITNLTGQPTGHTIKSFFGDRPPSYITVQTSLTETAEVPWGAFNLPGLDNTVMYFQAGMHKDYGNIFQIIIQAPRKYQDVINGIWKEVEKAISTNSIYRGKAFDGSQNPAFLDLSSLDPKRIVYSEEVLEQLEANLWNVIRHPEVQEKMNLKLKGAVLLYGPYGTGKSLAGMRTAQIAVESGYAFIQVRPGKDDLTVALQTARLYQPCVVFGEDIDIMAGELDDGGQASQVLDIFDGIQAKGTKIMMVLTSNHPEKLHKGMHRPGRFDIEIEIGNLDINGIRTLIELSTDAMLEPDIDWVAVGEACDEYLPAFVVQVAVRAVRYALVRVDNVSEMVTIGTTDLIMAAKGLRTQFQLMQDAPEVTPQNDLERGFMRLQKRSVAELASGHEEADVEVWNRDALAEVQNNHHG